MAACELHALGLSWVPVGPEKWLHLVVMGAGAALILAARRVRREERAAWLLLGLGVMAWVLGELYFTAVLWSDASPPVPSPADAGYLSLPPLVFAGLVVLARTRIRGLSKTLWADGLTAGLTAGAISAAVVLEPVVNALGGGQLGDRHQPQLSGRRPAAARPDLRPAGGRRPAPGPPVRDPRPRHPLLLGLGHDLPDQDRRGHLGVRRPVRSRAGGRSRSASPAPRGPSRAAAPRRSGTAPLISVPIAFALVSLAILVAGSVTDDHAAGRRARRRRAALGARPAGADLPRAPGDARALARRGQHRPAHRPGQPPRARRRARAPPRVRRAGADDPRAVRPRRLQELQRPASATRPATRCCSGWPSALRRRADRAGQRLPDGRRRVLRAAARRRRGPGAAAGRLGRAHRSGDGFCDLGLDGQRRAARGDRRRRRGAAAGRPADVRPQERRAPRRRGRTRSSARCSRRSPSATPSCPTTSTTSPSWPSGTRAGDGLRARAWSSRCGSPPSCTTSARWRSPRRSCPSPARSPTQEWALMRQHTVAGERIIAASAGAGRRRPAGALLARALGRRAAIPTARRRADPRGRADHQRLRLLPRDDHRPQLPQGDERRRGRAARRRRHPVRSRGRRGVPAFDSARRPLRPQRPACWRPAIGLNGSADPEGNPAGRCADL